VTEAQPYEVLEEHQDFEVRHYPEHLLVETEVRGPFELAGNVAFPRLARYIGGHNQASRKVAMTAPVVQEAAERANRFVVAFVMPADIAAAELPAPSDAAVRTRRVPAQTAAALRFSGPWTRTSYERHERRLLDAVGKAGLRVTGTPRYARYDPPWTPWFRRRNEVVVPVER
jgi:hypothetical protein